MLNDFKHNDKTILIESSLENKIWANLDDCSENISEIIEQYKESTKDILSLLEEVIKELEDMKALSVYWDFISDFFEEVRIRLGTNGPNGPNIWDKAKTIIVRRLRKRKDYFKQGLNEPSEQQNEYISELRSFLQTINMMTVEDIELMLSFKKKSHATSHQGEKTRGGRIERKV